MTLRNSYQNIVKLRQEYSVYLLSVHSETRVAGLIFNHNFRVVMNVNSSERDLRQL